MKNSTGLFQNDTWLFENVTQFFPKHPENTIFFFRFYWFFYFFNVQLWNKLLSFILFEYCGEHVVNILWTMNMSWTSGEYEMNMWWICGEHLMNMWWTCGKHVENMWWGGELKCYIRTYRVIDIQTYRHTDIQTYIQTLRWIGFCRSFAQ